MPKASKRSAASAAPESVSSSRLYSSFLPIPLLLPSPTPIPSSSKPLNNVTHHIYIRPHQPKQVTSLEGEVEVFTERRTLFVINLPVDMTERDIRVLFGRWGVVESVDMRIGSTGGDVLEQAVMGLPAEDDSDDEDDADGNEVVAEDEAETTAIEPRFLGTAQPALPRSKRSRKKPTLPPSVPPLIPLPPSDPRTTPYGLSGARSALLTFLEPISVSRALSYSGPPLSIPKYGADPSNPTGLAYYLALHETSRPSLPTVKEHADSAMARHDHLHSLLLSSRAKKQGAGALVDEDGFTVVVRGGRYGRTGGSGIMGVGVARKGVEEEGRKKKGVGAGELSDFYRFQKVDRKRQGGSV